VYDTSTHLQIAALEQREREGHAARQAYAARLVRLRRLDRRAEAATARARRLRLAL
jgi:hypothetical protein